MVPCLHVHQCLICSCTVTVVPLFLFVYAGPTEGCLYSLHCSWYIQAYIMYIYNYTQPVTLFRCSCSNMQALLKDACICYTVPLFRCSYLYSYTLCTQIACYPVPVFLFKYVGPTEGCLYLLHCSPVPLFLSAIYTGMI